MKKRCLIDFNHLAMRNIFMHYNDIRSLNEDHFGDGYQYLKYMIFRSLFSVMKKFKPDEYIVCTDGGKNWRKKFYPEYKANRKVGREKSDMDWEEIFEVLHDHVEEIKTNFPFKVIGHDCLEADDTIGWFCKNKNDCINVIVSSDKDLYQLLRYDNVQQWDPIKKKLINIPDPISYIKEKVLTGDKGDNVPPVRPRMGIKTAEKIVADKTLYEKTIADHPEEVKRNTVLIDLLHTPKQFDEKLEYKYNSYEFEHNDNTHLYSYFTKQKLTTFVDEIEVLGARFKALLSKEEVSVDALF